MKTLWKTKLFTLGKATGSQLLVPAIFILTILLFFPTRGRLEFDGDEGLNLMRGLLIDRGYTLYNDIWSDQPPIYPHILANAFAIFGYKVGVGRFISIIFSSLIFWGVFQIQRTILALEEAVVAMVFLFLLPSYLQLSVSVMVGLPSISLAIIAITFLLFWHTKKRVFWLLLSAFFLALSIQTKLFTAILAPICVIGIFLAEISRVRGGENRWKNILTPALIWGAGFIGPLALITIVMINPKNLFMLFAGHLAATEAAAFQGEQYSLFFHLQEAQGIIFLAVLGTIRAFQKRKWLLMYPIFWLLSGFIFLLFLNPIWYHHQLLVTIPAVILASYAVAEAGRWLILPFRDSPELRQNQLLQVLALLGVFSLFFTFRPQSGLRYLKPTPTFATSGLGVGARKEKMILTVVEYADQTNWMVTDKPMIAFRGRIPVPPEIAVLSRKRLETGAITEEMLIEVIQAYHPEQILLGRFHFPNLVATLSEDYSLGDFKPRDYSLYIRKDLLEEDGF